MSKQKTPTLKNAFGEENIKRLQDTTQRIQNIFDICDEFGKISLALAERKKAQPAIIMHFIVCKENFEKIIFDGENINQILDKEDMRGLSAIRNIASHDYEGLNLEIIESVIRLKLPVIKQKIDAFLQSVG